MSMGDDDCYDMRYHDCPPPPSPPQPKKCVWLYNSCISRIGNIVDRFTYQSFNRAAENVRQFETPARETLMKGYIPHYIRRCFGGNIAYSFRCLGFCSAFRWFLFRCMLMVRFRRVVDCLKSPKNTLNKRIYKPSINFRNVMIDKQVQTSSHQIRTADDAKSIIID